MADLDTLLQREQLRRLRQQRALADYEARLTAWKQDLAAPSSVWGRLAEFLGAAGKATDQAATNWNTLDSLTLKRQTAESEMAHQRAQEAQAQANARMLDESRQGLAADREAKRMLGEQTQQALGQFGAALAPSESTTAAPVEPLPPDANDAEAAPPSFLRRLVKQRTPLEALTQVQQPGALPQTFLAKLAELAQPPSPPPPFTLSEGQTRFDPTGQVVAERTKPPSPPPPFTLSEGQARFDPTGQVVAERPKSPSLPKPLFEGLTPTEMQAIVSSPETALQADPRIQAMGGPAAAKQMAQQALAEIRAAEVERAKETGSVAAQYQAEGEMRRDRLQRQDRADQAMTQLSSAKTLVASVEEMIPDLLGSGISGRLSGLAKTKMNELLQTEPARGQLEGLANGAVGPIARGIMVERGVLTEGDINRAQTAFTVRGSDTLEVARWKIASLKLFLDSAERAWHDYATKQGGEGRPRTTVTDFLPPGFWKTGAPSAAVPMTPGGAPPPGFRPRGQ